MLHDPPLLGGPLIISPSYARPLSPLKVVGLALLTHLSSVPNSEGVPASLPISVNWPSIKTLFDCLLLLPGSL